MTYISTDGSTITLILKGTTESFSPEETLDFGTSLITSALDAAKHQHKNDREYPFDSIIEKGHTTANLVEHVSNELYSHESIYDSDSGDSDNDDSDGASDRDDDSGSDSKLGSDILSKVYDFNKETISTMFKNVNYFDNFGKTIYEIFKNVNDQDYQVLTLDDDCEYGATINIYIKGVRQICLFLDGALSEENNEYITSYYDVINNLGMRMDIYSNRVEYFLNNEYIGYENNKNGKKFLNKTNTIILEHKVDKDILKLIKKWKGAGENYS